MKIMIHNFGAIKEAEFELRPLTIFVGPNNAGKTWVAYILASIFGIYGSSQYINAYLRGAILNTYSSLDKAIKQVINDGTAIFDFEQFITDYAEVYFNDVCQYIQKNAMAEFMSTDLASFEHLEISIHLQQSITDITQRILSFIVQGNVAGGLQQKSLLTLRKDAGDKLLYAYTSSQYISLEDTAPPEQITLPPPIIRDYLTQAILQLLHRALFASVHVLPTERTTYVAHPYQVTMRNNDTEQVPFQNQKPQDSNNKNLSVPLGYFLSMMNATIENGPLETRQREIAAKSDPRIKEYIQLAQVLEEQILNGKINYSQSDEKSLQTTSSPSQFSSREVVYQPTKDCKLEIAIASSMVKELTPLLFYLRYVAQPGELIIIDEPEMNLHPEAQVKLIEFLAMLVHAGLTVLITTHSPYVVDHLANLIKASEAENKEKAINEFYLKRADAFISKDKVGLYLFEQGKVINAMDEEGVIDLGTFGQVSDRISEIYFAL